MRNFFLKDGNHIREQLLALSDNEREKVSIYCILDAPVPLRDYVATVRLRPITDGNRTFAEWTAEYRRFWDESFDRLDERLHAESISLMHRHYADQMLVSTRLYPGVAETLAHFKGKRKAVA